MANTAQARKRARQALTRRAHNVTLRTQFRSAIKKVRKAISSGDKAAAQAVFREAQSTMDRVAEKGLFHKNMAARHLSRLSAAVKGMGGPA